MSQETLDTTGSHSVGGDFAKCNSNFTELYNEMNAKKTRDATASLTLNMGTARIFLKPITANTQFTLIGEKTGDEFVIEFVASPGVGAFNPNLITITGKSINSDIKIINYDNTKAGTVTGKVLFSDDTTARISYAVNQPIG